MNSGIKSAIEKAEELGRTMKATIEKQQKALSEANDALSILKSKTDKIAKNTLMAKDFNSGLAYANLQPILGDLVKPMLISFARISFLPEVSLGRLLAQDLGISKQLALTDITGTLANQMVDLSNQANYIVNSYLAGISNLSSLLQSLIQAQIQFRADFAQIISQTILKTDLLSYVSKQWTQNIVSLNVDFSGLKFDLTYKSQTYTETKQFTIEVDKGRKENGLIYYDQSSILKDGLRYKAVLVPVDKNITYTQTTTSLGYSDDKQSISITSSLAQTQLPKKVKSPKPSFEYDEKLGIIILNKSLTHTLVFSKSYYFINHCLKTISKDKSAKLWNWKDLIDSFEPEEEYKVGSVKRSYNNFKYFLNSLSPEMKDIFIIKATYIALNPKYIK